MLITMISRLMLRLHSNVTSAAGNYSISTTDFGSVLSISMIFDSQLAADSSAAPDIQTLINMELNRGHCRSANVLSQGGKEFER
jgi:hypothetical protein